MEDKVLFVFSCFFRNLCTITRKSNEKKGFSFAFHSFIRTFVRGMKVLIVNTSEQAGGAAVAANRLMDALNNQARNGISCGNDW